MAKKPNWEDFLDSFDKAQPDVVTPWGRKSQQNKNYDKFAGIPGHSKPAAQPSSNLSSKDLERIKVLEAQLTAPGRTDAEKESARRLIAKIKSKGGQTYGK